MKKLFAILGLLFCVATALASQGIGGKAGIGGAGGIGGGFTVSGFTLVNTGTGAVQATSTTIADSATSLTAGNVAVVIAFANDGGGGSGNHVTGISDTAGNTYVLCKATDALAVTEIWSNTTTLGNASNITTVTFNATMTARMVIVHQYSGVLTGSGCDKNATAAVTATTVTSGAFIPAASGNLNVAIGTEDAISGGVWTAGSNYTLQQNLSVGGFGGDIESEDRQLGVPSGSQTATISFPGASGTHMQIVVGSWKHP